MKIDERTFNFSLLVIEFYKHLVESEKEFILSKQHSLKKILFQKCLLQAKKHEKVDIG